MFENDVWEVKQLNMLVLYGELASGHPPPSSTKLVYVRRPLTKPPLVPLQPAVLLHSRGHL